MVSPASSRRFVRVDASDPPDQRGERIEGMTLLAEIFMPVVGSPHAADCVAKTALGVVQC